MLTNTKFIFNLNEKETGFLSKPGIAPKAGQMYPIYIPRLMIKIPNTLPTPGTVTSKGSLVFKNGSGCKVYANPVVKTQNFINVKMEHNTTWRGVGKRVSALKYNVEKGTQVVCNTKSNLIEDMTFSVDV